MDSIADVIAILVFFGMMLAAILDRILREPIDSPAVREFQRLVEFWIRVTRSKS